MQVERLKHSRIRSWGCIRGFRVKKVKSLSKVLIGLIGVIELMAGVEWM